MSESELFDGTEPVEETEDGFRDTPEDEEEASVDSEVDFDDKAYQDAELIDEKEAGNAEGGADAHLDDPEQAGDDSTW
ncbi:MAG TPA: hypothetical protein VFN50_06185 [Acidimicrobiales bacterium]|nr:hypothetical protein [Acidimicrobiales bacterium]